MYMYSNSIVLLSEHTYMYMYRVHVLTGILDCFRNASNASKEPRVDDCTYTPLSEI